MKKFVSIIAIVSLIAIMLLTLTGCGNTITAQQTTKVKWEVKMKGKDEVKEAKMVVTCMDKDAAEKAVDSYDSIEEYTDGDIEVEQKGKKVIITMDQEAILDYLDIDEDDLDKNEIEKKLKKQGYKVN